MEMKRALASRDSDRLPLRGGRPARHPRRYRVRILGDPPADLADRVSGLHAAAIKGRDDASEPSDGLVEPDDRPSGAVRRTATPHG